MILIDGREQPKVGAGERPIIAIAPSARAAIFDATGVRPEIAADGAERIWGTTYMRMLRLIAIALLSVLGVGRTASAQKRCFSARGNAVWVERHFRGQRSPDGLSAVEVRWKADTSNQRQGSPQQTTLVIRANPDRGVRPAPRYTISETTPAVARLAPGSYSLVVLGITYERSLLDVDVAPNDSIVLDVRLRSADYCEETVTIDETSH